MWAGFQSAFKELGWPLVIFHLFNALQLHQVYAVISSATVLIVTSNYAIHRTDSVISSECVVSVSYY